MKLNKKILVGFLFFIILVGLTVSWFYFTNPRYSLYKLSKAMQTHDLKTFEKYLDLDSVITNGVDQAQTAYNEISKEDEEKEELSSKLAEGFLSLMKPRFKDEIKQALKNYIETGTNDSKDSFFNSFYSKFLQSNLSNLINIKYDGKICYMNYYLNYPRYNKAIKFSIKLRDMGFYWQVAEFPEISGLMIEIDQLETELTKKKNEPIIKEIKNTLTLENCFTDPYSTDRWEINKYVQWGCVLKNNSQNTIDEYSIEISLNSHSNKTYDSMYIETKNDILPNQKEDWYSKKTIFGDNEFYTASQSDIIPRLEVEYIKFTNGKLLKLFKKFE